MSDPWPHFHDEFVESVRAGLARRRKALSHRGVGLDTEDGGVMVVTATTPARRNLVVEVEPDQIVHVYVRSNHRADRGRVLVRLEGLRVVAHPARLVAAFERTLESARTATDDASMTEEITNAWRAVALRAIS